MIYRISPETTKKSEEKIEAAFIFLPPPLFSNFDYLSCGCWPWLERAHHPECTGRTIVIKKVYWSKEEIRDKWHLNPLKCENGWLVNSTSDNYSHYLEGENYFTGFLTFSEVEYLRFKSKISFDEPFFHKEYLVNDRIIPPSLILKILNYLNWVFDKNEKCR